MEGTLQLWLACLVRTPFATSVYAWGWFVFCTVAPAPPPAAASLPSPAALAAFAPPLCTLPLPFLIGPGTHPLNPKREYGT